MLYKLYLTKMYLHICVKLSIYTICYLSQTLYAQILSRVYSFDSLRHTIHHLSGHIAYR